MDCGGMTPLWGRDMLARRSLGEGGSRPEKRGRARALQNALPPPRYSYEKIQV